MRVLALAAYPERIAATRFRVAAYVRHLARLGIEVEIVPWLDDRAASALYRTGGTGAVLSAAGRGLLRQLQASAGSWDAVWIQREAVLVGPPVVEALVRARRIPIVFDYDDAVWIAQGGALKRTLKSAWKFDWLIRHATHAIAGSNTLARRSRDLRVPTTVLPTVVESEIWRPRENMDGATLTIGWIGTHSTAPQLSLVVGALRRLRADGHAFRVVVVGAGEDFRMDGLDVEFRPWSLSKEVDDFRALHIGLAPMHSSAWHEGKCGFKQVQYMSVGVPFVTSLVGGARDFVVAEENALVAETESDWYRQISRLINDPELRNRLARRGRALVETRLCVERQASTLADVMRGLAAAYPTIG